DAHRQGTAMSRTTRRFAHPHLLDDHAIGLEARAEHDDHLALKLWLRLLACFDYLAQLHRHADGLRMSTLSRYLMVTGGNVTALTDELEREGMVQRDSDPEDRRSWKLRMTTAGRKAFERIAREHELWVIELFAGVDSAQKQLLYEGLGR